MSPNGRYLLFGAIKGEGVLSRYGGIDYNHGSCPSGFGGSCLELYLYDADAGQMRCVSCPPDRHAATAHPEVEASFNTGYSKRTFHHNAPLTTDGRYVFFSTAEPLVVTDTNGISDAYEFDSTTDQVRLLSSGQSADPSYFMDASADGRDVFIATRERFVGWDTDKAYDIYDVRTDGGFPEPPLVPPSCQGDACQPPVVALNDPTPGTATLSGPGNGRRHLARHSRRRHEHRRKHRRRHRAHARHKRATIGVKGGSR